MQLEHHLRVGSHLPWTPYYPKKAFLKCNVEYIDSVTTNARLMPKIIAFAFMRQAFLIPCSLACVETKQGWLLIFLILRQLYFITNESLLYKQKKTKAWDKFTLTLPSMKASITMEETTEFAVHAGMFPTSMKVFRISGRDPAIAVNVAFTSIASMKVFRISGRDGCVEFCVDFFELASMKVFRISGRDIKTQKVRQFITTQPQWKSSA